MSFRLGRFSNEMKHCLAQIMMFDVNDEVLNRSTVMDVVMSEDLKNANVYVLSYAVNSDELQVRLAKASGYIRKCLSRRLRSKFIPRLHLMAKFEDIAGNSRPD